MTANKLDEQVHEQEADTGAIDTSKMSEGKRQALELAESSRDVTQSTASFAAGIFMGDFQWEFGTETGATRTGKI